MYLPGKTPSAPSDCTLSSFLSLRRTCQGRRGDHQAEVHDDTWTMRVGEVGTDRHNTTLGNWRRDLTEGQSFVTCSDLRYPTADMRGGGSTGGQEELWSQRSSLGSNLGESCDIKSGEVQHIPTGYIY